MLSLVTVAGTLFPAGSTEMHQNLEQIFADAAFAQKMGCAPTVCLRCGKYAAMEVGDYVVCSLCEHVEEH